MLHQRYDTPEKLSATDAEVIQWRRLVVTKRYGGRDAPFEYRNPDGLAPDAVPLNRVSVRYLQEEQRAKAPRGSSPGRSRPSPAPLPISAAASGRGWPARAPT